MTDYSQDPEFIEWEDHVRTNVIPMISDSAITMSLLPTGETDVKFAVELGLSIMLDKPIIGVAARSSTLPPKLVRVCDEIVYYDEPLNHENTAFLYDMRAAMDRQIAVLKEKDD